MKKRIICILLAAVTAFALSVGCFAEELDMLMFGDADGDGNISMNDVVTIQLHNAPLKEMPPSTQAAMAVISYPLPATFMTWPYLEANTYPAIPAMIP